MGVISITQRSERLGNLGGTSAAHGATSTDIGQVRHTSARVFAPHYYSRDARAGDAALAAGLGKIGDAMTRIGAAVVRREEDRQVDDYANAVMDHMERLGRDETVIAAATPGRRHLDGQKRGFYLRTGEGTRTVVGEWEDAFADAFRGYGDTIDANDRVRERTAEKLANYRRATVSRLADRRDAEYRRMELDSAKGNLAANRMIWKNGRTEVLPDIFAQQERVDALTLATPETRKANREALALRLAADWVDNSLREAATPEKFDAVEAAVKEGLKGALPDLIAENLPGGGGTVGGDFQKGILDEVRKARRLFLAERDAEEREARQAVGRDFTERELKMRDTPQELWADAYEAMGRDGALRKADPKRAAAYMDAAREMRAAASKAKEKAAADAVKGNEENLARALTTLDLLKMDGSLTQDDADEAQAAIWRKFRTLSLGGKLSPSFMRSFKTRLEGRLTDQEAAAMRKFYRAFGYGGEVDGRGEVPASDRKGDESVYHAPRDPGDTAHDEKHFAIPAAELFSMGDELLRTLRAQEADVNREGVVEREIARIKTKWLKGRFEQNKRVMVRSIMDGVREFRRRFTQAHPEKWSGEDGGE